MKQRFEVDVGGRPVTISSPDRMLWPDAGFTKSDALLYYTRIAPVLLLEIRDRPLTLKRAPEGTNGPWWYQTECPRPPAWMRTIAVPSAEGDKTWNYCAADEPAALVWLANLGCLELHPLPFTEADPDHPLELVFDLDPGPPAGLVETAAVALTLRSALAGVGLTSFVKSSGAAGLHVVVPLDQTNTFEETKTFARLVAEAIEHSDELVVTQKGSRVREGKVLIDWQQNGRFRSVAGPYSLRLARLPYVAAPLGWDELAAAVEEGRDSRLLLLPDQVLDRVENGDDPWQREERVPVPLPRG
ncbi:MAG: non-homologous end-joining DNA ligase [Actinomycetota bacterium]|nr:non-homologous end-joining DNA ligase [Actinomycetota bacterium]